MLNKSQEITDLTICRALFAAWVFVYHVDLHAQFSNAVWRGANLVQHGYLGVDGFFILSGLLLAKLHEEFGRSIAGSVRFWGKRLARIYPVHLATLAILVCLVIGGRIIGLHANDPGRFSFLSLLQNLTLLQGWGFGPQWTWNYPSWSISSEWAGYLLFPVIMFTLGQMPAIVAGQFNLFGLPLLAIIAIWSGHALNVSYTDALPRFFIEFIWGIAAARLVPLFADALPTAILSFAGCALTILGIFLGHDAFTVFGLWFTLTSLSMHADAERKPVFSKLIWLRPLGLISYSFYMSFGIAELLMAQIFDHAGWDPASQKLVYIAAMTALTLILAVALHVAVEKPFRRLGDHWLREPAKAEVIPPGRAGAAIGRITPQKMAVRK
jgi:peptidoglycan/LPS O-acetylase OafA/YrhL